MHLPLWAFFGLGAAVLSATMMLIQEKLRINGFAVAFWNTAGCGLLMVPFVLYYGFPGDPVFYLLIACSALMYTVSDVMFFSGITKASAGAVARVKPGAVLVSFFLWLLVEPELIDKYLAAPVNSGLVVLTLCLAAFFAIRLRKCAVTMEALRAVWFVICAAAVGPMLAKLIAAHGEMDLRGPFAYVFCEAVIKLSLWSVWLAVKKPVTVKELLAPAARRGGLMIGCVAACMIMLNLMAYHNAENPAYASAVKLLDAALILLFYRMTGKKAPGDIASGLGIVACAAALIVLKSGF